MADRTVNDLGILGRHKRVVAISWAPNSASPVTDIVTHEGQATVVWTSTGTFTVTFAEKFNRMIAAVPGLQLAAADDKFVQCGSYVAASKTLVVRVMDNAAGTIAVADVAANANNRIHLICIFDDAS